jgi:hypothetical protein
LLKQFYVTLRVTYVAAPPAPKSVVHERIERLFDDVQTWRNAYEIEQLLCFVLSPQQLDMELSRRLAEAVELKLEHVAIINEELQATNPMPDKRIVLHRLLNDLQWFYSKRNQHRASSKRLMVRVSSLFIVALATFSLVLFIQFFAHGTGAGPLAVALSQPNTEASAVAGRGSDRPAEGQASPSGGAAASGVANPVSTNQGTANQATANPAATNRSVQDQANARGGAK